MAVACKTLTPDQNNRKKALLKQAKKFGEDPSIEQLGNYGKVVWDNIKKKVIGDDMPSDGLPSVQQLAEIKIVAKRELKNMTKDRSGLASWIYLPHEIYKDVPFIKKWFEDVQLSGATFKGNNQKIAAHMTRIYDLLEAAALEKGISNPNVKKADYTSPDKIRTTFSKKNVHNQIKELYDEFKSLKKQGRHDEALTWYQDKIQKFLIDGEGAVLKDFHDLVTSGKNFDSMVKLKEYKYVETAAREYLELSKLTNELFLAGLKNYENALKYNEHLKQFDGHQKALTTIKSLIKTYQDKEFKKGHYFPVVTFDVMPTLSELSPKFFHSKDISGKEFNEAADTVNNLRDIVQKNIYLNSRLGKTKDSEVGEIEYNVIPILDSYNRTASRFNYVSYNNVKYMGAIRNLWKSYSSNKKNAPTELDKKLEFYEDFITDTHATVTGKKYEGNESIKNWARAITSYQFASKLGLNIRSAARNSSQSLLNYIWFGQKGIRDTYSTLKNDKEMASRVDIGLQNNGILFADIQEIYMQGLGKTVRNPDGTYSEKVDFTWGDRAVDAMEKVAEKSGFMMQWVENKINRRYTFKLGYVEKWKADNLIDPILRERFDKRLERELKDEGKGRTIKELKDTVDTKFKKNDSNSYEVRYEQYRRFRAEKAAEKIVNTLHFDYSAVAKPKILNNPVGSVLGQFQYYGVSFFNLNRNIALRGKDAVMSGQWSNPHAYRMYRLGLLYTAVAGLISPLTNMNIGSLVQHDTWERAQRFWEAGSDDPDTRNRAWYGKGPIVGNFGGPFIADMVNLGNLSLLYSMDEDSWASYLSGYEDLSDLSTNERTKKLAETLNIQLGRSIFSSYPKWRQGMNPLELLEGELGLYPRREERERKEWLANNIPFFGKYIAREPEPVNQPKLASMTKGKYEQQKLDKLRITYGLKKPSTKRDKILQSLETLSLDV